jgi:hypothetical protein
MNKGVDAMNSRKGWIFTFCLAFVYTLIQPTYAHANNLETAKIYSIGSEWYTTSKNVKFKANDSMLISIINDHRSKTDLYYAVVQAKNLGKALAEGLVKPGKSIVYPDTIGKEGEYYIIINCASGKPECKGYGKIEKK